ncbi:unnamed protein product [Closterium sp. Naga37s-1]|nr:unnamed protein product [Closterium sp. Naga37s-1]CAI5517912.1 unnamed protein product [Closterium sp. Naga37s-1]
MEDPQYVAWMKEQKKQGKPSPSIKHMAKAKRDSAGASTSGGARRDYDDGADTDVSDDDLEEIVSESDSEADSDNYKDGSNDDGQDEDGGEEASGDERSTRASKKEKRPPAPRNKRVWSDAELATLAAARWNTKDDLKAMQGKQGSQYWMKLRAHIVEGDASWNRDEGQMSNAWKRLEKKYLKTKRGEGQSGGKAIKKKPWWEYMYNLKKHSAKAKAHALDGGGAATVDVPAYAPVPGTTEHAGDTPPPKRRRVYETATMAAAKLVSDAINSTNANVVRQLQDSTQTLVAVMNMAALQAGVRLQMATPHAQQAAPQTTPDLAPPVDTTDANMAFTEEVAEQPEP